MDEYDDLDAYNGDPVHDGWVDFDYNNNTGELSGIFDDTDIDNYINNLNELELTNAHHQLEYQWY